MSVRLTRSHLWIAALCAACVAISCATGPVDDALTDVASKAASGLSAKSGSFEKLAVLPFADDAGDRAAFAVTQALLKSGIRVLDRDDASFRRVIEEQRRAGNDLYSQEDAPRFGQLLVADAVLIGKVERLQADAAEATVVVELKAVITETGELVWSERISAYAQAPWYTAWWFVVAVVLVFVVGTALLFKYRRWRVKTTMTGREMDSRLGRALGKGKSDEEIRAGVSRALQNAKSQLSTARASLEKAKDMPTLRTVRDLENDMDLLRKRVEVAASGRPETMSVGQAQATFALDEQMLEGARSVEQYCTAVAQAAIVGNAEEITAQAGELKLAIHRLRTAFDERGDAMSGV